MTHSLCEASPALCRGHCGVIAHRRHRATLERQFTKQMTYLFALSKMEGSNYDNSAVSCGSCGTNGDGCGADAENVNSRRNKFF